MRLLARCALSALLLWGAESAVLAAPRPLPLPTSPSGAMSAPRVQLMFAVPNAEAYQRVLALVHDAQLTAMEGEAFVVVGSFSDARVAHSVGLSMQSRLRLAFELVYDAHHPQADLAWSRSLGSGSPAPLIPPPPLPATAAGGSGSRAVQHSPAAGVMPSPLPPPLPPPPLEPSVRRGPLTVAAAETERMSVDVTDEFSSEAHHQQTRSSSRPAGFPPPPPPPAP